MRPRPLRHGPRLVKEVVRQRSHSAQSVAPQPHALRILELSSSVRSRRRKENGSLWALLGFLVSNRSYISRTHLTGTSLTISWCREAWHLPDLLLARAAQQLGRVQWASPLPPSSSSVRGCQSESGFGIPSRPWLPLGLISLFSVRGCRARVGSLFAQLELSQPT